MTSATGHETAAAAGPLVRRVADMHLRGMAGPLRARVLWPSPSDADDPRALLVLVHADGFAPGGGGTTEALGRWLCANGGLVVLSLPCRPAAQPALRDAMTALEWAADHATELDADPGRLLIGGEGAGAWLAAAVALRARDQHWPVLTRQVLILPVLDLRQSSPLDAPSVAGTAPATIVVAGDGGGGPLGDGRRYAARLRQAGVEVEELRYDLVDERMLTDLTHLLRHTLQALPRPRGPTPPADGDRRMDHISSWDR